MALITIQAAKDHLQITDTDHDAEIARVLDQASAVVLDYLEPHGDPEWDETTAPLPVQAAVGKVLVSLYEHRGDDSAPANHDEAVWKALQLYLARFRDPAWA
jgi:hypothetical protein